MKKLKYTILFCLLFQVSFSFAADSNYKEGEMIIMVNRNFSITSLVRDFSNLNMTPKELLVEQLNIWLFEYNYERDRADIVLDEVRRNKAVVIAQFNHYVTQRMIFPNDTRFNEQWSLHNTGQTGGTPDADIDAPEAWNLFTGGLTSMGDSIIVAIVDGGFYLNHMDLKFWRNYAEIPGNNIDDDGNGYYR